jgi:hypothetical protein
VILYLLFGLVFEGFYLDEDCGCSCSWEIGAQLVLSYGGGSKGVAIQIAA